MSARKKYKLAKFTLTLCLIEMIIQNVHADVVPQSPSLAPETLQSQLGWVENKDNQCGGYYLEAPLTFPIKVEKNDSLAITGNSGLYALQGNSILQGGVTFTRHGQQMTANKAFLYRDPKTFNLQSIDLIGKVHFREPNSLVVAEKGHYNFKTGTKSLLDILYRTEMNGRQIVGPHISVAEMEQERKVTGLTAWGEAHEFSSTEPQVYELTQATFSTCPPTEPAWKIKASRIVINKITGRGSATNARILVRDIPVFYFPYINFPVDKQRKSGFLWPRIGHSSKWGFYFLAPIYWNIAPNYDMTITPGVLSTRGFQLSNSGRYLTETSAGDLNFSILPYDRAFSDFKKNPSELQIQAPEITEAELNRLNESSTTRKGFFWRDNSLYNTHWSSNLDFNYASDDYYLRDFGNLNEVTQNQLLQEADLFYKGQNWNFTGRLQSYQTLHPANEALVLNNYRRLPQLILNADYPDQWLGMEFFVINEISHFEILHTPGLQTQLPIGNRLHTQPGVSLPIYTPYFYINPRLQLALTDYNLQQVNETPFDRSIKRSIPIFDLVISSSLSRDLSFFNYHFQQTLEPQAYYTYIPYHSQNRIPIFDTTVNTLTYDQLFNYNRFTGIDRIGDANQIGLGVTTRLLDSEMGFEKVRLGVGEIVYFANRRVTFCDDNSCVDNPDNHANYQRLSPLSSTLNYHVNDTWQVIGNAIFNPVSRRIDNSNIALHYEPDPAHIFNLGYGFVRSDIFSGDQSNSSINNVKLTDISFSFPLKYDVSTVGRWSQDWNKDHFQNLLFGLQYDACCWAVRLIGGRTFTGLVNNTPQYNTEYYIEFALKGLGNIGSGNPSGLLSSITGYKTQFGQV